MYSRFETCWDSLWKVLKRYLQHKILIPEVPNEPNPILRLAAENNLSFETEKWLIYTKARVSTAHDYSEETANETLSILRDFIVDAINTV